MSNTQDRAAGVLLPLPRPRVLFPFVDRCAFEDHAVGTRLVVSMAKASLNLGPGLFIFFSCALPRRCSSGASPALWACG